MNEMQQLRVRAFGGSQLCHPTSLFPIDFKIGQCSPGETLASCIEGLNGLDDDERCKAGSPVGVKIICGYQVLFETVCCACWFYVL